MPGHAAGVGGIRITGPITAHRRDGDAIRGAPLESLVARRIEREEHLSLCRLNAHHKNTLTLRHWLVNGNGDL